MKNDFTQGSERGTYVRLDTSRSEGTWDGPPSREAQGHGAWIVLVGVTPDQGGQETWSQGEAKQVFGVFKKGGIRNGERHNWSNTHRQRKQTLESAVLGNLQAAFGGGPGEKGWSQYLACGLSYFALAFIGPKSEAEEIKRQLANFLVNELKLHLSEEKTLITHARSKAAKFLGYEITTLQSDIKQGLNKAGHKCRSINGRIGLRVPRAVLLEKCNRYKQRNKAVHRTKLLHESDYTIIATYQLEYRGIVNYYRLAYNLHTLQYLKWMMQQSLTKTLAAKHRISVQAVYDTYQREMVVNGRTYKVLQASVPREGKEPLIATWGGIPLEWDIKTSVDERIHRHWNSRSELEKRLLAQVCEACGATHMTDQIEVHHIRALKDLNKYEGREKTWWVKTMAARRRKTLILCQTCHRDLHAGRPLRRKVSRLRTEPL